MWCEDMEVLLPEKYILDIVYDIFGAKIDPYKNKARLCSLKSFVVVLLIGFFHSQFHGLNVGCMHCSIPYIRYVISKHIAYNKA